mmetsp:Transcript_6022/g.7358  ORF Transcript_6022/g.7358 Transcript_6022/m.7358 type:complete len:471 (-) Transcript_6022:48-1460(-)|eukprot:jgi/Bigna1/87556/estExt_fgenesh1_pg.C_210186
MFAIFGCCAGRAPLPMPIVNDEESEDLNTKGNDEHYSVGLPDETKDTPEKRETMDNTVMDLSLRKIEMEREKKKKNGTKPRSIFDEPDVEEDTSSMPAPILTTGAATQPEKPSQETSPPALDSSPLEPTPKMDQMAPTEIAQTVIAPDDDEDDAIPAEMEDEKTVVSDRGGRHKVLHFDLSHKMGFVISHNEASLLVHVIQISQHGQANEKGVEVGWIIDKVAGHNISEHEVQDDFGNERTKIVQKIVMRHTRQFKEAIKQYEQAKASGMESRISKEQLESLRWMDIEFLIPDEANEDEILPSSQNLVNRRASMKYEGKIPVQFRGENEPIMRGISDLPKIAPAMFLKKNPGFGGDKKKWVCLHKFALYYSSMKLDYEALEDFDTQINKDGERSKLNSETAVIPLSNIIDARVAKFGNKLILNLSNRKVVTFKRLPDAKDDLYSWAETIVDHKAYWTGLQEAQEDTEQQN